MNCIKTGARVRFLEYGITHAADLFAVGDAIVVHCNYQDFYDGTHVRATHSVVVGDGYMNKDKRIFVVPADHVRDLGLLDVTLEVHS